MKWTKIITDNPYPDVWYAEYDNGCNCGDPGCGCAREPRGCGDTREIAIDDLRGKTSINEPVQTQFENLKKSFAAAMIVTAMVGFALGWAVGVRDGGNNAMTVMGVSR